MALSDMYDGQPAKYFDLVNRPETLKLKSGLPIMDSELEEFSANRISVPTDWDVDFGDVLNWSAERPTDAYFVLEDLSLLKNPDHSGSGYLTIPFHVTSKIDLFL